MIVDDFIDYLKKISDMRICSESETMSIIQHAFKIVRAEVENEDIHYLWSKGFNLSGFLAMNRSRPLEEDNCRIFLGDILSEDEYYLIIDECCLQGIERPLCIHAKTVNLITTISDLNWELDEIYIVDITFKWLVAFNHVSEVMLYGDNSNTECIKIKDYIMHKFRWG